eukprot:TRINITY_DN262_c0_g1_i2.p1 TRINITY_DN262_c0_g1~~TRINITY_DN262_c0_g1_i2.p1  ORF type:complete len:373 (-),score=100.12 TRINITY_DN262_c0_g1_i2:422-1540(-)
MGKKGSKFADPHVMGPHHFKPGRVVGKGAFGKVLAVIKKENKQLYAMKLLNKKQLIDKKMVKSVINERILLSQLDFPFLVNLNYAFQTDQELCMVIDLMTGGDLRFHLDKGRFKEPRVVFYAACLILTLEHLQEKKIIHRDLKPDNYLLDADGFCHLTDFNISVELEPGKEVKNFAGTAPYTAPEVYRRDPYDYAVDWWSLGITMYEMLTGRLPFEGKKEELEKLILTTEPHYPSHLSPEASDVLQKLLVKNPAERLKSPEIRKHPFFNGIDWEKLLAKEIKPPFEPDRTRANVDGTFDLDEQFQLKPEKFNLSLEEHLQFQEWDWSKDKMPTRPIRDILEDEKPKKNKKISNSSSMGNLALNPDEKAGNES